VKREVDVINKEIELQQVVIRIKGKYLKESTTLKTRVIGL